MIAARSKRVAHYLKARFYNKQLVRLYLLNIWQNCVSVETVTRNNYKLSIALV